MRTLLFRGFVALLTSLTLLTGSGCSSLYTRPIQYIGVNRYPPTDPAKVQIIQEPPTRPHERLGEVVVDTSIDPAPPVTKIEDAIRREVAKMGGDLALLVQDRTEPVGSVLSGPWWGSTVSVIHGRIVVAVAIKYRD